MQDDFTVHFWQTDIIKPAAVIADILGVSNQFRDGKPTLGQVFLTTPIPLSTLKAMAGATNSSALSFRCGHGGLYQVEGHDVVAGVDCALVADDAGPNTDDQTQSERQD